MPEDSHADYAATMRSLLTGVTAAAIRREPFPHLVLPDAMPIHEYEELSATFPPFQRIAWDSPGPLPNNKRYQLSAWQIEQSQDFPPSWKEFVSRHSSEEFFADVIHLFREYWPAPLEQALDGNLLGHTMGKLLRDDFTSVRILQDARIEINTPVRERPSSVRGAHLDIPSRLFSGLFYMRHPDDHTVGGDLELFRWVEAPVRNIDVFQLPGDAVERVLTIPYRANQLVLFPNGIDALHGVSVREPTPHMRRYVFLTAEIDTDWLVSPAAA